MQAKRLNALWTLEGTGQHLIFLAWPHDSSALFLSKVCCKDISFQQTPEELNPKTRYLTRILLSGAHVYATDDFTACF